MERKAESLAHQGSSGCLPVQTADEAASHSYVRQLTQSDRPGFRTQPGVLQRTARFSGKPRSSSSSRLLLRSPTSMCAGFFFVFFFLFPRNARIRTRHHKNERFYLILFAAAMQKWTLAAENNSVVERGRAHAGDVTPLFACSGLC